MQGNSLVRPAVAGVLGYLSGLLLAWLLIWAAGLVSGPGAAIRLAALLPLMPGAITGVAVGWLSRGRAVPAALVALGVAAAGGGLVAAAPGVVETGLGGVLASVVVAIGFALGIAFLRRNTQSGSSGAGGRLASARALAVAGVAGVVLFGVTVFVVIAQPYPGFRQVSVGGATMVVPAAWVPAEITPGSVWAIGYQDRPTDWSVQLFMAPDRGTGGALMAVSDIDFQVMSMPGLERHECVDTVNRTGEYALHADRCLSYAGADGQRYEVMWLAVAEGTAYPATVVQVIGKRGYVDDLVIAVIKDSVRPAA